jgi:hypothetical protein
MSFLELLKRSREEAQQQIQQIANKIKEENNTDKKIDIIQNEFNDNIEKRKVDIDGDGISHPASYFTGLDEKTKREREAVIEQRQEEGVTGSKLYEDLPGDEDAKTKPSKYTNHPKVKELREEMKESTKEEFIRAASKVSGVDKDIIEEVYDKGLKAWATSGHRPGASAQQWAIARVYAFLFFPDSGARKADAHLWERHLKNKSNNIINNNNSIDDTQEAPVLIETKELNKSITFRQQLNQELTRAYSKKKKLYHKDKFAKQCYRLLNENKLYLKDFEFCFKNLEGLNKNSLDFKLLGGETMLQIQKHLNNKLTLEEVLSKQIGE